MLHHILGMRTHRKGNHALPTLKGSSLNVVTWKGVEEGRCVINKCNSRTKCETKKW